MADGCQSGAQISGLWPRGGDAIAALASEGLRWVTAQRIEVSGGALL
ncbi:hypothetical protein [Streptomyces misionensis]